MFFNGLFWGQAIFRSLGATSHGSGSVFPSAPFQHCQQVSLPTSAQSTNVLAGVLQMVTDDGVQRCETRQWMILRPEGRRALHFCFGCLIFIAKGVEGENGNDWFRSLGCLLHVFLFRLGSLVRLM